MDQTQNTPQQVPSNQTSQQSHDTPLESLPVIEAASGVAPVRGAVPNHDGAKTKAGALLDRLVPDVDTSSQPLPEGIDDEDAESAAAYQSLMRHRKERRRKKIVRTIVILAVIAAVAVFLALRSCAGNAGQEDVPTLQVDYVYRDSFRESVTATGSARPNSSVVVNPVAGTVTSVDVAAGDAVTVGQTLVTVENSSLDKAVNDAWFAYKDAENAVNEAQAALNEVWYGDDQAAKDETYVALEKAKAARDSAYDAYQEAVDAADSRTLKAPISGTVISIGLQVGQKIGEGTTGMSGTSDTIQIADLSQMRVTVEVSEIDITKISVGQGATVTFSALPDVELEAEVVNIAAASSGSGDGGYGYGGNVTYAVELLIPEPDPQIKPGMTASVRIDVQALDDVLMVPTSALMTDDGESYYVMVVTDLEAEELEMRPVTVLAESGSSAAVEGDLAEGDMVQIVYAWDTGLEGEGDYETMAG